MIASIAAREWRAAFVTPFGWVLLVAFQLVLSWVFLQVLDRFMGLAPGAVTLGLNLELSHNLFGSAAVLALLAAPLAAIRSIGRELPGQLRGDHGLLSVAPVSATSILLGKLIGLLGLFWLCCLIPLGLALSLIGNAPIDPGLFLAATIGLALSMPLFIAVGLFAGSLTSQPAAAAIIAYAILMLLSLLNQATALGARNLALLDWLSWNQHLHAFLGGALHTGDLAYFVLFSAFFLALAGRALANRRFR